MSEVTRHLSREAREQEELRERRMRTPSHEDMLHARKLRIKYADLAAFNLSRGEPND
jgi:hypothetical protein